MTEQDGAGSPQSAVASPLEVAMAYKEVYSGDAGQLMLADLMHRFAYTRKTTLVPGDPQTSAAQEGQRSVLVHIGKQIEADLDALKQAQATEGM